MKSKIVTLPIFLAAILLLLVGCSQPYTPPFKAVDGEPLKETQQSQTYYGYITAQEFVKRGDSYHTILYITRTDFDETVLARDRIEVNNIIIFDSGAGYYSHSSKWRITFEATSDPNVLTITDFERDQ